MSKETNYGISQGVRVGNDAAYSTVVLFGDGKTFIQTCGWGEETTL